MSNDLEKINELKSLMVEQAGTFEADYKKTVNEIDALKTSNKSVSAELTAKMDKLDAAVTATQAKIDALNSEIKSVRPTTMTAKEKSLEENYTELFYSKLARGTKAAGTLTSGEQKLIAEYEAQPHVKAMVAGTSDVGGYVIPIDNANQITAMIEKKSPFLQIANVQTTRFEIKKFIVQSAHGSITNASDEVTETSPTTDVLIAEIPVQSFTLESEPVASVQLLQDSTNVDMASFIMSCAAEDFANQINYNVLLGSGSNQPTGILSLATTSASAVGNIHQVLATSAVDLSGAVGTFDFNDLLNLKYDLAPRYLVPGEDSWCVGQTAFRNMRQMRTSFGQFLWEPSIEVGAPSVFDGDAVHYTQYMPNPGDAVISNAKQGGDLAVLYGNFNKGLAMTDMGLNRLIVDEITNKRLVKFYQEQRRGSALLDGRALRVLSTTAI